MAASLYDYTTIVEHKIDHPTNFLPTAMQHKGEELIWIKPAYATFCETPVDREKSESSYLCNSKSTKLPPYMERILRTTPITNHQKKYITEFKLAAATLDHWCLHKYNRDKRTEETINIWKATCNKLTQNPFFMDGWDLPVFYPLYSYHYMAGMQDFFATAQTNQPKRANFWKGQLHTGEKKCSTHGKEYASTPLHLNMPPSQNAYGTSTEKKQPEVWTSFFE
jgi:hypothetical protein